jgi:transposase-like protein
MRKSISVKTRLSAINDYVRSTESLRDVAKKYDVSGETLRRWLGDSVRKGRKAEVVGKSAPGRYTRPSVLAKRNLGFGNQQKRWSKLEDESLVEAVHSGMTVEETAGLLGRTPAAVYSRKHILVTKGKLEQRFVVPEGIKRTRKPRLVEMPVEVTPVQSMTEVSEVPEVDMDDITNLSLERLASVVSKFGVSLSINISEGVTSVQMTKV